MKRRITIRFYLGSLIILAGCLSSNIRNGPIVVSFTNSTQSLTDASPSTWTSPVIFTNADSLVPPVYTNSSKYAWFKDLLKVCIERGTDPQCIRAVSDLIKSISSAVEEPVDDVKKKLLDAGIDAAKTILERWSSKSVVTPCDCERIRGDFQHDYQKLRATLSECMETQSSNALLTAQLAQKVQSQEIDLSKLEQEVASLMRAQHNTLVFSIFTASVLVVVVIVFILAFLGVREWAVKTINKGIESHLKSKVPTLGAIIGIAVSLAFSQRNIVRSEPEGSEGPKV